MLYILSHWKASLDKLQTNDSEHISVYIPPYLPELHEPDDPGKYSNKKKWSESSPSSLLILLVEIQTTWKTKT
jgi:hypothetical protein